jgi:hypothetical protein
MSRRNGDRARFQKDRKRKLRHRQRIERLRLALQPRQEASSGSEERKRDTDA